MIVWGQRWKSLRGKTASGQRDEEDVDRLAQLSAHKAAVGLRR